MIAIQAADGYYYKDPLLYDATRSWFIHFRKEQPELVVKCESVDNEISLAKKALKVAAYIPFEILEYRGQSLQLFPPYSNPPDPDSYARAAAFALRLLAYIPVYLIGSHEGVLEE
jgi:hypothetical protein